MIRGGAGFVGSNVAASLDASGADIVILDRVGCDDFKWRNVALAVPASARWKGASTRTASGGAAEMRRGAGGRRRYGA